MVNTLSTFAVLAMLLGGCVMIEKSHAPLSLWSEFQGCTVDGEVPPDGEDN